MATERYGHVDRLGHKFRDLAISGETRVHLGDNYSTHHYHQGAPHNKPRTPHSTVPFARNEHFVAREHELGKLVDALQPDGQHKRIALQGLGGIGKSQTAIEFSYRYREQWPDQWIFYVHAGSKSRFLHDYRNIATAVELPGYEEPMADIYALIRSWLCNVDNGAWLFIIDNADDHDVFFDENVDVSSPLRPRDDRPLYYYIPPSAHGNVLITSRNHTGAELSGGDRHVISVVPLEEDAALSLIKTKLPYAAGDTQASELVATLDYIPLAITQAAAYIYRTGISIMKYLSLFNASEESQLELLGKQYYDIYQDSCSTRAITTSWKLSFEYIRKFSPLAADILGMMSMMDRHAIPDDIIFEETLSEMQCLEAIAVLLEYSLVQRENNLTRGYSMHRLVQVCTRAYLKEEQILKSYETRAISSVCRVFPDRDEPMSWPRADNLIPHVRTVLAYDNSADGPSLATRLMLMERLGTAELSQGNYVKAKVLYSKALAAHEKLHGLSGFSASRLRSKLVWCHSRLLEYQEAHDLVKDALHVLAQEPIQELDQVLTTMYFEILDKRLTRDAIYPDDFEGRLDGLLSLAEEAFGSVDEIVNLILTWRGEIASIYGYWRESEKFYKRARDGREALLGPEHGDTLVSLRGMAKAIAVQGRYMEAQKILERTLVKTEKLCGRTHLGTLDTILLLAWVYQQTNQPDDAENMYRRCLEGARETTRANAV